MIVIAFLATLAVTGVTLFSMISDVRYLRIPNSHALAIVGLFPIAYFAAPDLFGTFGGHVFAGLFTLLVTYLLFHKGLMGGGDSKLAAALGLWVGLLGLMPFFLYTAIVGGVLGIISLFLARRKPFPNVFGKGWLASAQSGQSVLPYGVAISLGAWITFFQSGFLIHQLNEVFNLIH